MASKITIIPTVFASDLKHFNKRLAKAKSFSKIIQLDIMDGMFVRRKSVSLENIPRVGWKGIEVEAHLMVADPSIFIAPLKQKGVCRVIAHVEAFTGQKDGMKFFRDCAKLRMQAGIAIKPSTSLSRLDPYLSKACVVLFLGVEPGKEGQALEKNVVAKIGRFSKANPRAAIQVDGGVNPRTIGLLWKAGARRFNVGSFFEKSRNPRKAIEELFRGTGIVSG